MMLNIKHTIAIVIKLGYGIETLIMTIVVNGILLNQTIMKIKMKQL